MRVTATVSGIDALDALIAKSQAIGGPAQIAKEARATVGMVRRLYLRGYNFERAPSGQPWASRKRNYPWPMLQKTNTMRDTTRVEAVADGVKITVTAEHAQYQHPARNIVPERDLGTWELDIGIARRNVGVDLG